MENISVHIPAISDFFPVEKFGTPKEADKFLSSSSVADAFQQVTDIVFISARACVTHKHQEGKEVVLLTIQNLNASLKHIKESPTFNVIAILTNCNLYISPNPKIITTAKLNAPINNEEFLSYISENGFAQCAALDSMKIDCRQRKESKIFPKFEVLISYDQLTFMTCTDSFNSLVMYLKGFRTNIEESIDDDRVSIQPSLHEGSGGNMGSNIMADVDEDAFLPDESRASEIIHEDSHDWQVWLTDVYQDTIAPLIVTDEIIRISNKSLNIDHDYLKSKTYERNNSEM